jgi:hypothetical protein
MLGILGIVFVTLLAGAIAYAGDRVGHRVGRARLTLFGLRPKYTSTVVAVATGMMIALAVSLIAIASSQEVRLALFHINDLRERVNQLQAEADELERHTHDENVVVDRGELLYNGVLTLLSDQPTADRARLLAQFFDSAVASVNQAYGPGRLGARALRPINKKATDPDVKQKLDQLLTDVNAVLVESKALVLVVADQNMFPNDPIHFRLQAYPDRRILRSGETIAVLDVPSGTAVNPGVALNRLTTTVENEVVRRGMPFYFANSFPITSEDQLSAIAHAMVQPHGALQLEAHAAQDIYPHLGEVPIDFVLKAGR